MSWWSSIKSWATIKTPIRHEVFQCPKCGAEISRYAMGPGGRGIDTRWTDLEIIARCPTDGHPPWNGAKVRKLEGDRNFV